MSALRGCAPDIVFVLILLVGAWVLGSRTTRAHRQSGSIAHQPAFDLQFFGVALMNACGRGAVGIVTGDREILPSATGQDRIDRAPVGDFLDGRRERVGCDRIGKVASMPLDPMLRSSSYLITMASAAWRLTQPNWPSIDALMGGLFAVTIAASYGIGRLGMGPIASAIVAVFFALSPLHLSGLSNLRDYSKAPFFAIALLVCGVLARKRLTSIQTLALVVASGVVLGLGFGMRTDVGVYLPLIVATLLLFTPDSMIRSWRVHVGGALVCLAAFLSIAWPVIAVHAGGNTSHWAILGFSHEFDSALGVRPGPYRLNYFYNDGAVATIVTAFGQRTAPTDGDTVVNLRNYDAFSRDYLSTLVRAFPADALVRMWAGVLTIANLPFSDAARRSSEYGLPMGLLPAGVVWALDQRRQWLASLNGAGFIFLTTAIVGIAALDVRLAAFIFVAFCCLAGSSAIQFQPRHVFHLELLTLWILSFVLAQAFGLARTGCDLRWAWPVCVRRLPVTASFVVVIAGAVVVPLAAARVYQRGSAERLLSGYERAPRDPVPPEPQQLEGGWTRLGASTLGAHADQPAGSTRAEMVVVQVSALCNGPSLDVRFTYDARTPASDFSRTLSVRTPPEAEAPVDVFMPVYYAGADLPNPRAYRFSGIDIPASRTSCVQGLFRFREPSRHKLLLEAVLPRNWRDLSLFQSLEVAEHPRTYAGGVSR